MGVAKVRPRIVESMKPIEGGITTIHELGYGKEAFAVLKLYLEQRASLSEQERTITLTMLDLACRPIFVVQAGVIDLAQLEGVLDSK